MSIKKRMLNVLSELLKNSKRSDRELAKVLGLSQPTVTRIRRRLVKERVIKEFTVIPTFAKMGYQILTFLEAKPELIERAREWSMKQPCMLFAWDGEGLGMNSLVVSVH